MSKKSFILILLLFFSIISTAQDLEQRKPVHLIPVANAYIDTIPLICTPLDVNIMDVEGTKLIPLSDLRVNMVMVDKKVLMALLKPFYKVSIDSISNDTLIDADFYLRYRKVVNPYSKDTSYIPLPKKERYLTSEKRLRIDTLKILNPIKKFHISTPQYADDPIWWHNKNSVGIDISQASFVNWSTGGNNSISGLVKVNLVRSYKKLHLLWNNEIFARYGLNKQQEQELRKTDDKLQINSTFGYRRDTISNWFYSVKFNFNTQFTDGYSYPDISTPISKFFAPAYLFLGAGTHYEIKNSNFSVYISPITLKSTFVNDTNLSNEGAFGVEKGKTSRHEFGTLVESTWNKKLAKNVVMSNKLSLYSDYLNKYGNIDINWELHFNLSVNKHLKATIGGYLLYDNDIKFKDDVNGDGTLETFGPRVQLKQLLGIGVLFVF